MLYSQQELPIYIKEKRRYMKLTQDEKEVIIASKMKKFKEYEMISQGLITELVNKFDNNDVLKYLGMTFDVKEGNEGIASNIAVSMTIDEILYYYLSKKAKTDDELLLQITFDKQPLINKIQKLLKGNYCDKDDALMEAILEYPGYFSFDSWLVHYVKSKVNNTPFDLVKEEPKKEENNLKLSKKKKKK